MSYALIAGVFLLALANGANDNFKGVATLWGTGRYRYGSVLAWGTLCTFAGALAAAALTSGLVSLFNGQRFLVGSVTPGASFFAAAALGAAATLLLATLVGAPVSTTHALMGSLLGAGLLAAGAGGVKWMALGTAFALPLLLSPLLAMGLTSAALPPLARWLGARNCICVTQAAPVLLSVEGTAQAAGSWLPALRVSHRDDCHRGDEISRWNTEELVHWSSAGLISFSRGLNDAPKIAALVLAASLWDSTTNYLLVATAMALGGLVAAAPVARTMSMGVTRIEPLPGLSANLVGALLVGVASPLGLPVSTTHVTMGGIFGLGVRRRRDTNWGLVRAILLAWVVTMPLGLVCGLVLFYLLRTLG